MDKKDIKKALENIRIEEPRPKKRYIEKGSTVCEECGTFPVDGMCMCFNDWKKDFVK